ncbi:hypothetical protein [Vibrio breoganii]|uniref:hypothetical protein n=1 Tax=Vibrio breoganii TaxID=553239 RepID=UPI000C84452D|nr:hypothetical protein [Vibrio breoganii]PMK26308.1 hypothetical protein BCU03_19155 [Vibrio breoganii]
MSTIEKFEKIIAAETIEDVNRILTQSMADKTIQGVIKDENLASIIGHIVTIGLTNKNPASIDRIRAVASLARLAAVARSRQHEVYSHIKSLIHSRPCAIELLSDSDEKHYFASALLYIEGSWVTEYCLEQSTLVDTSENTRKKLIELGLGRSKSLEDALQSSAINFSLLAEIESEDTRIKRAKRLTKAWAEIIDRWDGETGNHVGIKLADWLRAILALTSKPNASSELIPIVDDTFSILKRSIELRFSQALVSETYQVLDVARNNLSSNTWNEFNRDSIHLPKIKTNLKEAALVLARQSRTDSDIMKLLSKAYYSKSLVVSALKRHFGQSKDIDPDVQLWWLSGGKEVTRKREATHEFGNSEDQQIGTLLIEVESSQHVLEKLERAVVPFLEISDPPLASTVKRATTGFADMSQISKQLARMRKLTVTDMVGQVIEYNPRQHEMLGGHQYGVRHVKVVRDGIQKEFGGKTKTLVKPWVEATSND